MWYVKNLCCFNQINHACLAITILYTHAHCLKTHVRKSSDGEILNISIKSDLVIPEKNL